MKKYDFITKKFLIKEYVKNEKSKEQLARELNCSVGVITNRLRKFNIHIRNLSGACRGDKNGNFKDGETLIKHYCIDCLAKGIKTEISWHAKRCKSCANKNRKGKEHYNVKENHPLKDKHHTKETKKKLSLSHGGTGIPYELTEYGAEFDNALKEQVRFRDRYKCKICGCSQLENGRQLDVHHIDYDKDHCELNNLISLCKSCHMKTNFNRKHWQEHFERNLLCRT